MCAWLRAQGCAWRVGITQFAVDQLGDITLVDRPEEGDLVTTGQRSGTVESVKRVSDRRIELDRGRAR